MIIDEDYGIKVAVSPEQYEEIKKSKIIEENKILKELQNELDKYEEIIDTTIEYIEKYDSMIAIVKKPDEEGIFGFDGNFGIKEELLNILKGSDKE